MTFDCAGARWCIACPEGNSRRGALAKANRPLLRTPLCGRVMHLIHAMHVLGHAERLCVNGNQYWGGFGIAMRRGREGTGRGRQGKEHGILSRSASHTFLTAAELRLHIKTEQRFFPAKECLSLIMYPHDIMSSFQVISLEGWTDVMYFVQDAHSFWNWLYFVLLIVVSGRASERA